MTANPSRSNTAELTDLDTAADTAARAQRPLVDPAHDVRAPGPDGAAGGSTSAVLDAQPGDAGSGADRAALPHVVIHDFSGHPFQAQLARRMAELGHEVTHLYCTSFTTPQGNVGDEAGARSVGIGTRRPFAKYSAGKRLLQELEYGWKAGRALRSLRPGLVVSSNVPLIAAFVCHLLLRLRRVPVVFWQQDVYSVAMANHLDVLGRAGRFVGHVLIRIEQWLLRSSKGVVVISEDFVDTLREWGIPLDRVTAIENWAPLEELPVVPRRNAWAEAHDLDEDDTVIVYAGTLGLKHEPAVLLELANAMADRPDVKIIVASEGLGADWLRDHDTDRRLIQLPFQPYDQLPLMLGAADVLVVLLEADAGTFSVPSKVLTYHCAGRAILGAMPSENLASRNIQREGSGLVTEPGDAKAFVEAARKLVDEPEQRAAMGKAAREYAEATFDIDEITARFEAVFAAAVAPEARRARRFGRR